MSGRSFSAPNFRSGSPWFESFLRWNSAHDCTMHHGTKPFIIILSLSSFHHLGPVIQSVVSLTSSLRVVSRGGRVV